MNGRQKIAWEEIITIMKKNELCLLADDDLSVQPSSISYCKENIESSEYANYVIDGDEIENELIFVMKQKF